MYNVMSMYDLGEGQIHTRLAYPLEAGRMPPQCHQLNVGGPNSNKAEQSVEDQQLGAKFHRKLR